MATSFLFADLVTQREAPAQRTPSVLSQIQKHAPAEPRIPIQQADIPITITAPGSYRFASNLEGGAAPVAITIASSGVSIDLAGFTLSGGESGTGIGGAFGATIRNGLIRWFSTGIDVGDLSVIEAVTVDSSHRGRDTIGIRVGSDSPITRSHAIGCENDGGHGIIAGERAIVTASSGKGCDDSGKGISVGGHSVVVDSYGSGEGAGIEAGEGSTLRSCTAEGNIEPGPSSVVTDCSAGRSMEIRGYTTVTGATADELWILGEGNLIADCSVRTTAQVWGDGNVMRNCVVWSFYMIGSRNRIQDNHILHDGLWDEGTANVLIGNTVVVGQ